MIGSHPSPMPMGYRIAVTETQQQLLCFAIGPLIVAVSASTARRLDHLKGSRAVVAWLANAV
eukprot:9107853-Heterocapsa_arctica.AAC.1